MTPHFILDMETIGQNVFKCPIINCSYVVFDWDRFTSSNPYTFEELLGMIKMDKLHIQDQINTYGASFKKSDLEWWQGLDKRAQEQLKPSSQDITSEQFIAYLITYLKKELGSQPIKRWWSRANCFDPVILERVLFSIKDEERAQQLRSILKFWLIRDVRTYIDVRFEFNAKHNGFCPMMTRKNGREYSFHIIPLTTWRLIFFACKR